MNNAERPKAGLPCQSSEVAVKEEVVYPEVQPEAPGVDLERLRTMQTISDVAKSLGQKAADTSVT